MSVVNKIRIKLDGFRKIGKQNLIGQFWELSNELLNRISSVYKYCINDVYVL